MESSGRASRRSLAFPGASARAVSALTRPRPGPIGALRAESPGKAGESAQDGEVAPLTRGYVPDEPAAARAASTSGRTAESSASGANGFCRQDSPEEPTLNRRSSPDA